MVHEERCRKTRKLFGMMERFDVLQIHRLLYLQAALDDEILQMSTDEIISRTKLLENEIKVV